MMCSCCNKPMTKTDIVRSLIMMRWDMEKCEQAEKPALPPTVGEAGALNPYHCPCCDNSLFYHDMANKDEQCFMCGQRIDWKAKGRQSRKEAPND